MNKQQVITDFQRKLNGSIVYANPTKEWKLYHITVKESGALILNRDDLGTFETFFGGTVGIKIDYPDIGYFVHERNLYLLLKAPQRQWRRGIHDNLFSVRSVSKTGLMLDQKLTIPLMESAFSREHRNFDYGEYISRFYCKVQGARFVLGKAVNSAVSEETLLGLY